MSFNQIKKRKNSFNNVIKHLLFGKGQQQKKIILGKAKGIRLYVDPAHNLQRLTGTYEREILSTFSNWAKKCRYFFDIGAFDGYYSLIYKKYNPAGNLYLFDIDKSLEDIQKTHFAINSIFSNTHLYFKSVSDTNDEFHISADSFEISNSTILIKIDVEGAESVALHGMKKLLSRNNCFLLIETHSLQLETDCVNFLQEQNYTVNIIKNAWWRFFLAERRPLAHNRWLAAWK
jgi:hypothetical protein